MNLLVIILAIVVTAEPSAGAKTRHHGETALSLNETVSVDARGRSLWYAEYSDGYRMLNAGHIYYEPPQLQTKSMKRLDLYIASTTVREALDALVKADGNYSWELDEDVVVFVPKRRNRKFVDPMPILAQVVPIFEVKDAGVNDAVQELLMQASAQGIRGLWPPQKGWKFRRDTGVEWEDFFSLRLENKTVRECLNAIVRKDSPAHWIAIPYQKELFIGVNATHSHGIKSRKK